MRDYFRQLLRTRVLPKRGIHRAHIIGCARSGTTMLHYAMASFEKTTLHQVESNIRFTPSISHSLTLCRQPFGTWLVTKREFGWFEPKAVAELIRYIRAENIALINVVRDPRDVLVSRHAGADADEYYVHPDRWEQSIKAGQEIVDAVEDFVPTLTLRYEDIIMHSEECEARLVRKLGLIRNPALGSFNQLKDNMTQSGITTNPWMRRALHTVRNFDHKSIGKWQSDPDGRRHLQNLLNERPELHRTMTEFMQMHNYDCAQNIRMA